MVELRGVDFWIIQKYFLDFQKKTKDFDLPQETAELLGIYEDGTLVGYFVTQGYDFLELEILQGYLIKEHRHKGLQYESMKALEDLAKKNGYKKLLLATNRSNRAYPLMAKNMGFKQDKIIYGKDI